MLSRIARRACQRPTAQRQRWAGAGIDSFRWFSSDVVKTSVKDLKVGKDLVLVDGRVAEILELSKRHVGRGAAPVILNLRSLPEGNKFTMRVTSDAMFDKVTFERRQVTLMFDDGSALNFLDENSMEEFQVAKNALSGVKQALLTEGVRCIMTMFDGKALDVDFGESFEVQVEDAGLDASSRVSASYKTLILKNGLRVSRAPMHVKTGDTILVHLNGETIEFVGKKS
ncbi:Elongation factor P [Porphyridium purpureum]|uniref:Elongation factor P n=1 Tax=Porphyridium purpureum TaxID=35688 RepID=A0A5J4YJ76_PORPP|nr:Elongation factor P [Porphyridium purpureum]|eukprot:POR2917..scf291_13